MTDPGLPPEGRPDEPSGPRGEQPERPEQQEQRERQEQQEQREQQERQELDIEAEFAAIVAAWDGMGETTDTPADPVARWPVSEDVPGPGGEPDPARDENGPSVAAPPEREAPAVWRQGPDPLAEPVPMSALAEGAPDGRGGTETEEQFVPPDPPPVGGGDVWLRIAWLSVFGGPLFLIACLFLLEKPLPTWTIAVGVGGFVGGFAMLVARMPVHRDDDDDGAVV